MFDLLELHQVKELHTINDAESKLKAFVAIHNTHHGPALGGCRFIEYTSEQTALEDAVRLAKGMSYKAVMAGLPQGGGKAVILKPAGYYDHTKLFQAFGQFIEGLSGRYITAIDSGTSAKEMDIISSQTRYVTSTTTAGNPSPFTAKGVFHGIKAAVQQKIGRDSLEGLKVAIQGVGNVGYALGQLLNAEGAHVIVADINQKQVERALNDFAKESVHPDVIHKVPCTVYSPCGLSGAINTTTVKELGCLVVAGSANVQLAHPELGQTLHQKGILYAPDYVINAGGLIYASLHHNAQPQEVVESKVHHIYDTLTDIFNQSKKLNLPTSDLADQIACSRLYHSVDSAA